MAGNGDGDEQPAVAATATTVSPAGHATEEAHDAVFQSALDEGTVSTGEIVEAKVMASPQFTADAAEQAIGKHYYPLLLAAFRKAHKGVQFAIQEDVGFGVVLLAGDQEDDPEGDKIDWAVIRKTLRFDWTLPRELLIDAQELADEVRRWLRNSSERRDLLGALYSVMTQIGATIGRENRRATGLDEGGEPSERIEQDISIIQKQLDAARAQFKAAAERAAQLRYVVGMVGGAGVTLVIWGVVSAILALEDINAINSIAIAAGAFGACVSVLERMTRGKLEINAQSGDKMILAFGALRPVVGAIFGYVVYLVIRAELISLFVLPKNPTTALAYVAVFGFIAGFNERFAQDVLANASNSRQDA
jgi:hypothetical protein